MLIDRTLGHYHITAELGAGGMGEVYRATDTTLGREVAIKVLPADVAADPDRVARFRREARLLASLNHPNIGAIYGFEEADGAAFLTLELIEGEDLAARLRRGPIPVPEALEIAKQIAEALEAAHERGVIHRDLKPANVKVTPSGTAKVLDFGLAKAWAGDNASGVSSPNPSLSPTFVGSETAAGVILGTAAYMSPEQARGRVVDRRADVWAFGVVLYEMLTGRALFGGETITDVIAAVVRAEPDLSALPPETPVAVRRLLRRCLQKDPRLRLPHVGAARVELSELLSGVTEQESPAASGAAPASARSAAAPWRWLIASAIAAGLALGAYAAGRATAPLPPKAPLIRFSVPVPHAVRLQETSLPSLSPDGRFLVLAAQTGGRQTLWLHRMDSLTFEPLSGTEDALALAQFWSPDSRWLAFVANRQLKRLDVGGGGGVQRLATLESDFIGGGAWGPKAIVLSMGRPGETGPEGAALVTVPPSGGAVRPLTAVNESAGERGHYSPQFMPDGRHLAFRVDGDGSAFGIVTIPFDDPSERRLLLPERTSMHFARGRMLFMRNDTLLAQPLSDDMREVRGEADPIAEGVNSFAAGGVGLFSASSNGVVAFVPIVPNETQLTWLTRAGAPASTMGEPRTYGQIVLSPDGKHVAVELQDADGAYDIWIVDVARGVPSRLTFARGNDRDPVWSPDGSEVIFGSNRDGPSRLFRRRLTDRGSEVPLFETKTADALYPESWTPDGRAILYQNGGTQGSARTGWIWRLDGSSEPAAIVNTGFSVDELQVSPDGRLLAYISAESGRYEVYVAPLDEAGAKVRVSIDGGGQPKWRRDGRELYFVARGKLHAVEIRAAEALTVGLPQPLFDLEETGPDFDDYAPSADGQRFLVKRRTGEGSAFVEFLLHWDQPGP